jgi:hypothetical protein
MLRLAFLVLLPLLLAPIPGVSQSTKAPPELADSAWSHLARYVGPLFAKRCLSRGDLEGYVEHASALDPGSAPGWRFYYRLKVPEARWVREQVAVTVDLQGRLTPKYDKHGRFIQFSGIDGIGNCARNPSLCKFPIDREAAIRIAKRNGLERGLAPWEVGFNWYHSESGRFIWHVSNTLQMDPDSCSGSGKSILIDANDGHVYQRSGWSRICCR